MAAEEGRVQKRGPETPSSANLLEDENTKRLPEYSSREEEFIEENYIHTAVVPAESNTTDGLKNLHEGTALLKYTRRNGVPHFKFVQLSRDNTYLRWYSKRKTAEKSTILISNIQAIHKGQQTDVFKRSKQPQLEVASFSVLYNNGDTFDIVAKGSDEAEVWFYTLSKIFEAHQNGEDVSTIESVPISLQYVDRYRCNSRNLLTGISGTTPLSESAKKTLRKEVNKAEAKLKKVSKILEKPSFSEESYSALYLYDHKDFQGLGKYHEELVNRKEQVGDFLETSTNDKISRSDVWRLNVDCDAILEKSEVCLKEI